MAFPCGGTVSSGGTSFKWQSKILHPFVSQWRTWLLRFILEPHSLRNCHETCSRLYTPCFGGSWLRAAEQRSGLERSEGDPSPPGKKPGRCRRGDASGQIRLQTYAAADELCRSRPAHYRIEQLL